MTEILTKQQAEKNATGCFSYNNGDYEYEVDGFFHLIRNGVDLLEGKNAIWCYSYDNGNYEYEADGFRYSIKITKIINL